jgi:transcriptional regulator with XRE-family HTH domain
MPRSTEVNEMPTLNKIIGGNIRFFRNRLGLTQKGLGAILGVTPQMVSKWECGSVGMTVDKLGEVANVLHVPPDYLLRV